MAFYDDNGISIDGHVQGWFTDDTPKRFEAYGWRVIRDVDGHDSDALDAAMAEALTPSGKPTLVCCKTVIGWGAPKMAGTHDVHGAPLGADEIAATRKALNWPYPAFEVPGGDPRRLGRPAARCRARSGNGSGGSTPMPRRIPDLASEFQRRIAGELPADFAERADACIAGDGACHQHGRDPQGVADAPSKRWPRCCPNCSAARPT